MAAAAAARREPPGGGRRNQEEVETLHRELREAQVMHSSLLRIVRTAVRSQLRGGMGSTKQLIDIVHTRCH